MNRFTFFMFVLGCALIVSANARPALGQPAAGECAPEELAAAISDRLAGATGERDELLGLLRTVAGEIAANDAACAGLSFEGNTDSVLGPLTIPAGTYTYEANESTFMTMELTVLDGECGEGNRMSDSSFIGDASAGSQGVFISTGCEVLIAVTSIDPWTLVFEKVR